VLKIGPTFDSAQIGLKASTLVALRVAEEKIVEVVQIINQYDNISHNYQRNNEYNVWFTLTAKNDQEINLILEQLRQKVKIAKQDMLNLPTKHRFKINVVFQITNDTK
jgi:hypothetical protein